MVSKNSKINSYLPLSSSNTQQLGYEQFLKKKYSIPNNCQIIIKQGSILSKSVKLENNTFKLRQLVYEDIKNDIEMINNLINSTSEEIYDLVQFTRADDTIVHLQTELIAENLFAKLSNSMNVLAQKVYERFAIKLSENSYDKMDFQLLNSQNLPQNEVYGIIDSSLENLKDWFFDNIDSMLGLSNDKTQKDFLSDAWSDIQDFFGSLGEKISGLIHNIVSLVQTAAKDIVYQMYGYQKYQVIPSGSSNICGKCQQMSGKIYRLDKMQIGTNAPPFHPHCECTIIGTYDPAPMAFVDPSVGYDREAAVAYALEWAQKFNPDFPDFSEGGGDCANFVSQCLLAGGFEMNGDWYCEPDLNLRALFDQNYNWKWSILWSGAKEQYEYLKNSNIISEEVVITSVDQIAAAINDPENPAKIGDIMYLKFDQERPHHATIISKVENGMIYFAAHTDSYEDKSLSQFFNDHKKGSAHILKIK